MGYRPIRVPAQDEFTEQRSRFIGAIAPVTTEEEALAFLAKVRGAHRDARHHVFAFVLKSGVRRCSDDGEPQGTGGVPTLEVLLREGVADVAVVVTRYFGGILLGAGGLVRAYSHAAKLAVDAAQPMTMSDCAIVRVDMAYNWYGAVQRLMPAYNAKVRESDFGERVRLELLLRAERVQPFLAALVELSANAIVAEQVCELMAELE